MAKHRATIVQLDNTAATADVLENMRNITPTTSNCR